MRLIVPYTDGSLQPLTVEALRQTGREYQLVLMEDDEHYFRLLSQIWEDQETTCIVEQDIVVRPDTIDLLMNCESGWCAFPYGYLRTNAIYGLGCVKFSGWFLRRTVGAMSEVAEMWDETHPPKHWCRLDGWLQQFVLPRRYEDLCRHLPPLKHLSEQVSHGCIS